MNGIFKELKALGRKKTKVYSVAIRKRNQDFFWDMDNPGFEICTNLIRPRYWAADPFLFEHLGTTYLFYEWFDLVTKKGSLAYSVIDNEGCAGKAHVIIKAKTHFSFPFVFELNGEICILPETSAKTNLELYVATDFPDKWEKRIVLRENFLCCDSIVFSKDDHCYILSSALFQPPKEGTLQSCYVKNILFSLKDNQLHLIEDECGIGDYGIRNAGRMIYRDQEMFRVGQICSDHQYGKGIALWKVNSIHPYEEVFDRQLRVEDLSKNKAFSSLPELIGFHTYNQTGQYEVIDISYDKPVHRLTGLAELLYRYSSSFGGKVKKFFDAKQT